jgi:hypothetical protein
MSRSQIDRLTRRIEAFTSSAEAAGAANFYGLVASLNRRSAKLVKVAKRRVQFRRRRR